MRWSLRLGSVAGIGIFVHWSFLLIIGWVIFVFAMQGQGPAATAVGILFVLSLFFCVVLHELGHALTARRYNIPTRDITLLPIGGVARLERMPEEPSQEFWVAIAGPAVNVAIAALLAILISLFGTFRPITDLDWIGGDFNGFWVRLMWFNLILVAFNILPAFPMDGGRILRSLLARKLDFAKATRIAATVGQGMAFLFGFIGLVVVFSPFLILIGFFVYIGAKAENNSVQVTAMIRGFLVSDAMMRRFRTLEEEDELSVAVEQLLAGSQQEFPVMRNERVVGLLTRRDLVEALAERGRSEQVSEVMRSDYPSVEETEPLEEVFHMMLQAGLSSLPVLRDGELVGLLSSENVGELVMINSAMRRRKAGKAARSRKLDPM